MELPKNLKDEIWEYCRVNNITNIDEFTLKLIKQGFTVHKFGATPVANERIIEKIIEKIIEVPVEKIVEVEKIIEIEKIINKEVYITDNKEVKQLTDRITELEIELKQTKLDSINNITTIENREKSIKIELEEIKKELEKCKKNGNRDFYGER